jgi:NADPH:quinone reductase-like Zn-dependent oxidoreductase
MKALAMTDFDTPASVIDVPASQPGEGELLVDVEHASINGMDVAVSAGYLKGMMEHEFPVTLGRDFAGTVAAVGPGVTDYKVGDAVFGLLATPTLHHGTLGEQLVINATTVGKRPSTVDAKTAAALALAGTAAKTGIDALALGAGDTVLVSGATGGVGAIAVQLAKLAGAKVIATATPDRATFVRGLGADEVVDHTGDLAGAVKAIAPNGVDAVFHAAGDPNALADLLRPGGRIASALGFGQQAVGERDITATPIMSIPSAASLGELAELVASGKITVPISKSYPLEKAQQALQEFAGGKVGKISIDVR